MSVARHAAAALSYVNLLIMMYAGAAGVLSARLRWDPVVVGALRAAAGAEGRTAGRLGALGALGAAVVLSILCAIATAASDPSRNQTLRRTMLVFYALAMVTLVAVELWLGAVAVTWGRQVARELQSQAARPLLDDLRALLRDLARYGGLPREIDQLIEEALQSLPALGTALGGALLALPLLQLLGALLASLAATATASSIEPNHSHCYHCQIYSHVALPPPPLRRLAFASSPSSPSAHLLHHKDFYTRSINKPDIT